MSAFVIAYTQSDFFGKLIIFGLIAISMICWIVLLHKTWIIKQVQQLSVSFQKAIAESKNSLLALDSSQLPRPRSRAVPHPFALIYNDVKQKTLEVLNKNHYFISQTSGGKAQVYLTPSDLELLEAHAMATISTQNKTLEKNLYILSTIVTLAPFVGLLGTVIGIIRAFAALESSAGQVSATLMTEIGEALVATAIGILVALPSVAAYNGFQRMIRARIGQADALSHDVLAYLKSNRSAGVAYRDVAGEKPSTKSAA